MTIPNLPAEGSTAWYAWVAALDAEARTIAAKETPAGAQAKATAAQTAAAADATTKDDAVKLLALNRLNHTGTQAQSTITNLTTDLAAKETPAGAQAKADAALNRLNHTGTQAQSTIVNLTTDLAAKSGTAHTHDLRYVQTVNGVGPDPVTGDVSLTVGPDPAGYKDVTKTADQSVTSSTVLVNDTALLFAMAANETWDVDLLVLYQSAATDDLKVAVNVPAGATITGTAVGLSSGAAGASGAQLFATVMASADVLTYGGIGATTPTALRYSVRVVNGATAGNFQFQFAQSVSGAVATTVLSRSNLIAVRK